VATSFLSASWYRVAELRPQLRRHAQVQRQRFRGRPWYVLLDPASGKVHRFTPGAYHVLQLMDGRRSIDDIWKEVAIAAGVDAPTQDELIELLGKLHSSDLLQTDLPPDVSELAQRGARQKRQKLLQSFINPLSIRIPLWDPDTLLNRTWPSLGWIFGPIGLLLWLLVLVPGVVLAAMHWQELGADLSGRILGGNNLLLLLFVYPAIKFLHEMGHAYAVKSGGGEVHEMGVMLLVLAPIPYVDATATGAFRSKWRRALVGAAGMLVELFLAALAMIVWVMVEPGLVRSVAYNVVFVAGVSTLIFNGNPLLRYDAYYILADLIEVPNLAQRSNQAWQWLAKRYAFGAKELDRPQATAGEWRWFMFYGPASFLYRSFVMIAISLFVAGEFFFVGVLLAIWGVVTMFVLPVAKGLRYVMGSPEIQRQRQRAMLVTFGGLAVVSLFALVVPLPLRTHAEGIVWVPENAEVRASGNGFVQRLLVPPNGMVAQGDPLLLTQDPELDADLVQRGERVRRLEVQYASQMFEERLQAAVVAEDLGRERVGLARTEERLGELMLTAPVAGRLRLARAEDLPERYVRKGELLGYVLSGPPRIVRVVVSQDDIALVRSSRVAADVKIADRLAEDYPVKVLREVPGGGDQLPNRALSLEGGGKHGTDPRDAGGLKSLERLFQFDLELPESVGELQPGTRVHVRFRHAPEPLASQWGRRLRQLFLSRFHV
jgi:putative peptide zinc metalloprotease protein